MREFKKKDAQNIHIIVALILLVLAVFIQRIFPPEAAKSAKGDPVPIIGFEFAQSEQEILNLYAFENPDDKIAFITAMHVGNNFDFAYMIFYTLFLISAVWWVKLQGKLKWMWIVIALAIMAFIGDALENYFLLKINDAIRLNKEFEPFINSLSIITRLKWFVLSYIFILFYFLFKPERFWLQKTQFIFLLSLPVGIIALFYKPYFLTIFVYLIMMSFLLVFLNILFSQKTTNKKQINT
jgi:hypothetical protein